MAGASGWMANTPSHHMNPTQQAQQVLSFLLPVFFHHWLLLLFFNFFIF